MVDKFSAYLQARAPEGKTYKLWPLYGAGFENLGLNGQPIDVPVSVYGPDELLVRHDACGLCFSDTKVIAQGQNHPRVLRDMETEPVVLGHEVAMTVIGVGENLQDQYKVGERLTLETDILVRGRSLAYGYWFQGGLSQYSVIGPDIYAADNGNNLIKIDAGNSPASQKGYAEVALIEPWACVMSAYTLNYRTMLKPGGLTWIVGAGDENTEHPEVTSPTYTISSGFDFDTHPAKLFLTNVPVNFSKWLKQRSAELSIDVVDVPDLSSLPFEFADDIIVLGVNSKLIELVSQKLARFGVLAVVADSHLIHNANVDIGRIHYHRWLYVGTTSSDIAAAYQPTVRSTLKSGGCTWFLGAGGPMGRMHVQRAIEFDDPPGTIVCTDISDMRLNDLCESFSAQAKARGIQWLCLNPLRKVEYKAAMEVFLKKGFDDVVVLAPIAAIIADAAGCLAPGGVMNVFAGVARGTLIAIDLGNIYLRGTRIIGHSASLMSDFELVLSKMNTGELSPNRSVVAVGSLSAARDGLLAVKDARFAGKVVIYPHIKEFPLTPLSDLKNLLPSVYELLKDGREWTNEAEAEFLRVMLP